jgi:hypothetical protein
MIAKLIDIGRSKFNGEVEGNDLEEVLNKAFEEVNKHLLSREVGIVEGSNKDEYFITAGFHTVGRIRIVK